MKSIEIQHILNKVLFYLNYPFYLKKIKTWVKRYVTEELNNEEINKLKALIWSNKLTKKEIKKEIKGIETRHIEQKYSIWSNYLEKKLPKKYKDSEFKISNTPVLTNIIVETRKHPHFKVVVQNIISNTQHLKAGLQIYHGTENEIYVKESLKDYTNIQFINLNVANINIEDYNKILLSKSFHENISSDKFLVFQTDSISFKQLNKSFLKYDYIGAPWKKENHIKYQAVVGNGGLSLRSKTAILSILNKNIERPSLMPEDLYLAQILRSQNYIIPTFDEAMSFSIEEVFYNNSFGCHKCWDTFTIKQLESIFS